jgi:hypothetical protein
MSVIVALFLGLIMSAEEIIMDRKILLRESFLKLSKISYLNSKVTYVFAISAIQSFLYVVIGNSILNIPDMMFSFWLMMFSVSCFANLLGLLISSVLKSVIAIYIMVPLIIVPQMLLSGVVIKYDKINKYVASKEYVPVVGDLMTSRWAYEAMVVKQFSSNDFQKYYFETEKKQSNVKYNLLFVIPELKSALKKIESTSDKELQAKKYKFLIHELSKIDSAFTSIKVRKKISLKEIRERVNKLNTSLANELNITTSLRDDITKSIRDSLGDVTQFVAFKNSNHNNGLADMVLNRKELEPYRIDENEMIRFIEPIYLEPASKTGRAHFLAASKKIGNLPISTFNFNLVVVWLMSIIVFSVLVLIFYFRNPFKRNNILHLKEHKRSLVYRFFKIFY